MHDSKNIWVLEDDEGCQFVYQDILDNSYQTKYFITIKEFVNALESEKTPPNIVIADLSLPDGNLLTALATEKKDHLLNVPFMVVSCHDDIESLRTSFEEGALDYMIKPFNRSELLVKLERILGKMGAPTYQQSPHGTDSEAYSEVLKHLTLKETKLFKLFTEAPDKTLTREDINQSIWNDTIVHPKTLDVHIYNLRKKLKDHGLQIISHVRGKWTLTPLN